MVATVTPIREPQEIGTIVRDSGGELWVLVRVTLSCSNPWASTERSVMTKWKKISNPVIIHEGRRPPPPEPRKDYSMVIDNEHGVLVRQNNVWCPLSGDKSLLWGDLVEPIDILFEGE